MGIKKAKKAPKVNQRKKFYWRIVWSKDNITRFVFFCFFGIQIILCAIFALIIEVKYGFKNTNNFLIFWPIVCLIIDFFIMRKILIKSQPKD